MFFTPFGCFSRKGTLCLLFFQFQNSKKVYPSEENVCFSLLLAVFLVRVHFVYYFSNFKIVTKVYPSEANVCFFTPFDSFSHKGFYFVYYFSNFKIVKKVYLSKENVCFSLLLTISLVRVYYFLLFFQF